MNLILKYSLYTLLYIPIELVYIILLLNFAFYKLIVYAINKYYYFSQRKYRIAGLPYTQIVNYQDNFFFWIESPSNLSYNTLIIQLGGRVNADEYKKIITEKILTGVDENGEAVFAKMRQVVTEGYFFSTWDYVGEICLDDHVRDIELDLSTDDKIEEYISQLDSEAIPNDRPQWMFYHISDPKVKDISYIIWRVHHAIGDGVSGLKVIFKMCDTDHKDEVGANKLAITQLTSLQRMIANIHTFIMVPFYLINHLEFTCKHTRTYGRSVEGVKRISWSNKLEFEKIREVKSKTKTTVNDVLLTLVTEATRRYFTRHSKYEVISKEVIYGMGVALDINIEDCKLTNNDAGILILTPTNVEGIFNQLKMINRKMKQMKHELWPFYYSMSLYFLITLPIPISLIRKLTGIMAIGIGNYSNIPGPSSTLSITGTRVVGIYAIVMTSWDQLLALVFATYQGRVNMGVKTDADLVEHPRELIEDFVNVLEEMYSEVQKL